MEVLDQFNSPTASHILKKIGDLKSILNWIRANKDKLAWTDSSACLKLLDWLDGSEDAEIYFGFMNDKYWYPDDMSDEEVIEQFLFDTIVIFGDEKLLSKLYEAEKADHEEAFRKGESDKELFDGFAIKTFENGRKGLWLWMD